MLKQAILLTALIGALTGCTYGHMHYSPSYEQEATMRADSRRVQADERAERALCAGTPAQPPSDRRGPCG